MQEKINKNSLKNFPRSLVRYRNKKICCQNTHFIHTHTHMSVCVCVPCKQKHIAIILSKYNIFYLIYE